MVATAKKRKECYGDDAVGESCVNERPGATLCGSVLGRLMPTKTTNTIS